MSLLVKEAVKEPAALTGKYVIGLTGNKCSGKTTVAAMLAALGATIVDVDQLVQGLQAPGQAAYNQIVEICGVGVLEGQTLGAPIKREELARIVYADASKMQALERQMGPAVHEESCKIIQVRWSTLYATPTFPHCLRVAAGGQFGCCRLLHIQARAVQQQAVQCAMGRCL